MKAIFVKSPGDVQQLAFGEFDTPTPKLGELLIKIKATALNRADILQRQGKYAPPKGTSPILGLEVAGIVESLGGNCPGWRVGDKVCALLTGGGYAEYITIPAKMAIPVPDNIEITEAAAIPEVFLTAYQALFFLGGVKHGENVLIHAGASGVGSAAIQLCKAVGANPFVTVRSASKIDFCYKLGAKMAINATDGLFVADILETTKKAGVNLVLDCIGAAYWAQNIEALSVDGRLVLIAMMGGFNIPEFSLIPILRKRLQITGTTLRARSPEYKVDLTRSFVEKMLPSFESGDLKPVIDSTYSWRDVPKAHHHMEQNLNLGKIILVVD